MFKGHVQTGTVTGTGAAINVPTGFKPSRVELHNVTGLASLVWTKTMAAASGVKTITAGTMSFITSNGVSHFTGTAGGDAEGFTIGADTDVNVSAEVIHYTVYGDSD